MRTVKLLSIGILALAILPATAAGQTIGWIVPAGSNIIDVGARGTDVNGDSARYERYRDLGDGLFLEAIRWDGKKNDWRLTLRGDHSLYKDQRYVARAMRPGRVKAWFMWDQIPMLMSNTTKTLYREDFGDEPKVFTIDPAIRAQVQASPSATPNTSVVPGLFDANARTFDTEGRRHTMQTGVDVFATPDVLVKALYQYTNRQGVIPYGGSFGHSSLVEFPAPIKHTTNDFDTSAEYARDRIVLRGGYSGSWFTNDNTTAEFANPFRTYDALASGSCTVAPGVVVPCSSAPATGRLSLPQSNSFFTLNGLASVKLPARSRLSFYLSGGTLKDAGDPIMSQTVNAVNIPLLTPLERTTVEGEAVTFTTNLNFVSRPNKYVDISARLRTYDYDNRTPEMAFTQRVSYDNAPGVASMNTLGAVTVPYTTSPIHTEPFGVKRNTLDLDFRTSPRTAMTAGVGYSRMEEQRNHRLYEDTVDHVFRLMFDAIGNKWFSLRTKYEHAERTADLHPEAEEELFNIGEQPGIRHFDIAQRDRDRVTILGTYLTPKNVSVYGSVAFGKDDYFESEFGLRDNKHRVYTLGFDAMPTAQFTFGASYSYEYYNALSRSRQASPPPSPGISYATYQQLILGPTTVQVADSSRNWASDGTDRVHSFILAGGVSNIRNKVDLHFSYDMNRSDAAYNYITGPVADRTLPDEVPVDTTLTNCNVPENCILPLVINDLDRFTTDLTYWVSQKIGFGFSYWYEQYRVEDWALDAEATSKAVLSQAMILGYNYRPYTANTFWVRLLVKW